LSVAIDIASACATAACAIAASDVVDVVDVDMPSPKDEPARVVYVVSLILDDET
jgi:hypothetical protein